MAARRIPRILHGLRLLDFAQNRPHQFLTIPRAPWLLAARTGNRYRDRQQNKLEMATLIACAIETPDLVDASQIEKRTGVSLKIEKSLWHHQHQRSAISQILGSEQYAMTDVLLWARCFAASSLASALEVIPQGHPWPIFLVLYTLHRRCNSTKEAHGAIRLYEQTYASSPDHYKPELTALALRLSQEYLPDLAPAVARVFVSHPLSPAPTAHTYKKVVNELLWLTAKVGTLWTQRQSDLLLSAALVIARGTYPGIIDTKGATAVAWLMHFSRPDLSLELINGYPTFEKGEFAYRYGPQAIRAICATSSVAAVAEVEALDQPVDPFLWALMIQGLRRHGLLRPNEAMQLWTALTRNGRVNGMIAEQILGAIPTWAGKTRILTTLPSFGLKVTPRIAAALVPTRKLEDLLAFMASGYASELKDMTPVLSAQAMIAPGAAWETYMSVPNTAESLRALCRAAWDPHIMWDGISAPQRAMAEFQSLVRGFKAPGSDILRIYPTEALLYAYVFMCGRAGYGQQLLSFLDSLDAIAFKPTKRLLCALIWASPQGPGLLRLGSKARQAGGSAEWPTKEELDVYELEVGPRGGE